MSSPAPTPDGTDDDAIENLTQPVGKESTKKSKKASSSRAKGKGKGKAKAAVEEATLPDPAERAYTPEELEKLKRIAKATNPTGVRIIEGNTDLTNNSQLTAGYLGFSAVSDMR